MLAPVNDWVAPVMTPFGGGAKEAAATGVVGTCILLYGGELQKTVSERFPKSHDVDMYPSWLSSAYAGPLV